MPWIAASESTTANKWASNPGSVIPGGDGLAVRVSLGGTDQVDAWMKVDVDGAGTLVTPGILIAP